MNKRWILFFLIFTTAWMLLIVPMGRKKQQAAQEAAQQAEVTPSAGDVETTPTMRVEPAAGPAARVVALEEAPTEVIDTPLERIEISLRGGVPISWQLLPSEHVAIVLENDRSTTQVIELVPQVQNRSDRELPLQFAGRTLVAFNDLLFESERAAGEDGETVLKLTSPVLDGVQVIKTFTFHPDSYLTDLRIEVLNGEMRTMLGDSETGWAIGWQGGFMNPESLGRMQGGNRAGGAVGEELRMKGLDADDAPIRYETKVGWGCQERKYFMAMLVPPSDNLPKAMEVAVRRRNLSAEYQHKGVPAPMSLLLFHPQVELQPGGTFAINYSLIVTPKDFTILRELTNQIDLGDRLPLSAVPFDQIPLGQHWLRSISLLLLSMLRFFESHLHNWGWAIIILVLIVKIVLYPLSHWAIINQAKTMAEQQRIKPYLEKINEKYKDDPAKKSQEMMKLYREHNINPFGMLRGCFPILLQMPIFFALYVLLDQAVELRGQSFLWINDLTQPDALIPFGFKLPLLGWSAFNILPILMAVTQFFSSRLMTANISDPMQKQMMIMMPIFFVFILYNMPSGLMLYWTVQNIWQIGHTVLTKRYVATHDLKPGPAAAAPAKS